MKKVLWLSFLAVCFCFFLVSPRKKSLADEKAGGKTYLFYYLNREETRLLTAPFDVEDESTEELIRRMMTNLNDRRTQGDGYSLLPADVTINAYTITGEILDIEFSESYRNLEADREFLLRMGVVHTFLQIPSISGVSFRVGQEELYGQEGQPVGVMDVSRILDLSDGVSPSYRFDSFTLYFATKDGEKLVEETRSVYYRTGLRRERIIVEQLAKGPMEKDHYPTISENTLVNEILVYDGVCYLDLNSAFVDYQVDVAPRTAIYSVVDSLIASGDIDKVMITIDGNDKRMMNDSISLYRYYKWNKKILQKNDEEE